MSEEVDFDSIFQWNMDALEVEAFKLAVCYEKTFRKIFGSETDGQTLRMNSLPKRSDPRKSNLFRHCWKMRRETRGLIEGEEYKNFIHANIIIIKLNNGRIQPNCICGDKSWIRYKVWKRRYDVKMAELNSVAPPPSVSTTNPKIIAEIDRTKKFLFERCEGEVSIDKINGFINNGIFKFWVASGKVTPYYVLLSPFIKTSDELLSGLGSSAGVFRDKLTTEVKDYFAYEFKHEYS